MRHMTIAAAALCFVVLAGCAAPVPRVQEAKPEAAGPAALSLRVARHPDYLRIVFEGTDERVKRALVETPDDEVVTVQFEGPVVITHEQKGLVTPERPVEVHQGVALVLRERTCTLIVISLREIKVSHLASPPRLVIDAYLSAQTPEQRRDTSPSTGSSFRKGSEPEGFRGFTWGTGMKRVRGLMHARTDPSFGGVELYTRKGETLRIGSAQLESVEYGFWQGKLSHVILKTAGLANWLSLRDVSFARFGDGYRPSEHSETYWWFGEIAVAKLDYHEIPEVGFLYLYSKEVMNEQEGYTRQKAAEGARKGF